MEPITLPDKRVSRKDLVTGIGASFCVHVLVFSSAFLWAWLAPHKAFKAPYCAVNLVSLKDLGMGSAAPRGSRTAPESARGRRRAASSARNARKSSYRAPVKRLALNEPVEKSETHIKKIEPHDVPLASEKPESLENIDKSLDKLITRPKPVVHKYPAFSGKAQAKSRRNARAAQSQSQSASAQAEGKSEPGSQQMRRGTETGVGEGGAMGTARGGAYGSPAGSGAISAVSQLYGERVRNAIIQEWVLPEQNVGTLETTIRLVVSSSGQIISMQIQKPSGDNLFDEAALRAIRKAEIPAMPAAMNGSRPYFILHFSPQGIS